MERRGEKGAAAARARRPQGAAEQPSFSSTLLDAIYKSMDEPGHDAVSKKKQQEKEEALHYSYYYRPSLAGSYRARAPGPAHATTTTSSSSDCSSYGGFSSSEAETSSGRHHHRRLRPIRTAAAAPAPPAPEKKASKKQQVAPGASIRAKLRDLRKAPASPGARLAGFLNTIFAGGGGKRAPQTPPSASAAAEYACSTASSAASYSRSCLSKTPSTRGGGGQQQAGRTVRFVDSAAEAPATVPGRRMPARAVEQMLLRRMEMESDEEDEESSDASSDLFELENFTAAPPGAAGDELPVYETTRVVLNRGSIGGHHGYGHGRSARVV
ncbi:LOW QUALITY PROTEIN: hypothetical protein BRADI_1g72920v3 [Brachypodium distachyon]|uniref:Protein BIG GRAIN 1 n=1 Tax=Brachypodium distachyon TaxID=15368 RepID=A0A2K2DUU0_BRADI|nr:LOW QUALITY PROTEIN: hypothetical protein BRADI_1g72920v3 [Brachypodium distachyon]